MPSSEYAPAAPSRSPAVSRSAMQQALLSLWDRPTVAAETLYALHQGALQKEITTQLSELGPMELCDHAGVVILPWRLTDLPPLTRLSLLSMGLGGGRLRLGGSA